MANLTLRSSLNRALTIPEMDGNFEYFTGSYTNTGTITAQGFVGDLTGSVLGNVTGDLTGNADTATTSSYVDGANVDGYVALSTNADNAATASYVAGANVDGYVALATDADLAATASYVAGADVDGDVASATTAYNLDASSGEVVLPSAAPGTPVVGSMYYGGALEFYIYDGATWRTGSLS